MNVAARPHQDSPERDEWLTVDEVCAELKISRRTFDRWRALMKTLNQGEHAGELTEDMVKALTIRKGPEIIA